MVHLWAWFSRGEQLPESTVSQSHSKVTLETLQVSRAFLFPSIGGQWRRARPLCCVWRAGESPPLLAPCSDYRDILDGARLANACQRLFENRCILNSLKISINHFSGAPTAGEILTHCPLCAGPAHSCPQHTASILLANKAKAIPAKWFPNQMEKNIFKLEP